MGKSNETPDQPFKKWQHIIAIGVLFAAIASASALWYGQTKSHEKTDVGATVSGSQNCGSVAIRGSSNSVETSTNGGCQ